MPTVTSSSLPDTDLAALRMRHAAADVQTHFSQPYVDTARYAKCVEVSKRIRWDIDRDVIRIANSTSRKNSCLTACRSSIGCRS